VREVNQAGIANAAARTVAPLRGDRLMVRPHREVSQRLAHMAAEAGYPAGRVSPYIADILAEHVGLHRHVGVAAAPAAHREKRAAIDIQREPATATAAGRPLKAVTGREAARAEMRRLAQRAAERRAEQAAREAARRESAVRAARLPEPEDDDSARPPSTRKVSRFRHRDASLHGAKQRKTLSHSTVRRNYV
jgi:hypothetical protein